MRMVARGGVRVRARQRNNARDRAEGLRRRLTALLRLSSLIAHPEPTEHGYETLNERTDSRRFYVDKNLLSLCSGTQQGPKSSCAAERNPTRHALPDCAHSSTSTERTSSNEQGTRYE